MNKRRKRISGNKTMEMNIEEKEEPTEEVNQTKRCSQHVENCPKGIRKHGRNKKRRKENCTI
jgi:hypothetical protein